MPKHPFLSGNSSVQSTLEACWICASPAHTRQQLSPSLFHRLSLSLNIPPRRRQHVTLQVLLAPWLIDLSTIFVASKRNGSTHSTVSRSLLFRVQRWGVGFFLLDAFLSLDDVF